MRQFRQQAAAVTLHHAATTVDYRLARRQQQFHGLLDLTGVALAGRIVRTHLHRFGVVIFELLVRPGEVFGNINHHRSRAASGGDMKRFLDRQRNVFGSFHQEAVLHYRPGDTHHIGFLEGVLANQVRLHLAGKHHDGYGVHVGGGDAGNGIGGARPGGHQHNPRLARRPGIAIGGVSSGLLMPHQDVRNLRVLEQRVVNMQDRATGIAEDELDTFVFQCAGDHFTAG